MREYEKVVVRKRAESELNRASYGHLKSSQQKSTTVNDGQWSQRFSRGALRLKHGAPRPGAKIYTESSSRRRAREARRAFRISRVARRAVMWRTAPSENSRVAHRASCFFSTFWSLSFRSFLALGSHLRILICSENLS